MNKLFIPVSLLCIGTLAAQTADSLREKTVEEVVVVGYGSQRKSKVSNAVSQVELDKIGSRSLSGVGSALQGKAPGVTVINEGGDPTSSPRVNIRGLGGINGEAPLYVVDGVVFEGTPNINPNDVESISVLKDASAAIYGARASGGVVLISTKQGKRGALNVELDAKYGISKAWKLRHSLNASEFQSVMTQAYQNEGKAVPDAFDPAKYPDGAITRTDWVEEIFRTGVTQEYNINLTGGGDRSRFFVGMNHRSMEGILDNTQAKRYSFRVNSDHTVNDWLKIGENMYYHFSDGNSANTASGYTGAILAAMYYPSNVPVYDQNGNFSGLPISVAGSYGDMINPVAYLKRLTYKNPTHEILINPYVEISLLDGLKFRSNFSQTFRLADSKEFTHRVLEVGKIFDFNRLEQNSSNMSSSLAEQILSYKKTFSGHTIDATVGYTFQKNISDGFSARGEDFRNEHPNYQYLVNANDNKNVSSYKYSDALTSLLGRVNYDYRSRYIISLLGRRDGSSMVSKDNRYENYYAVSGAWGLGRESFFENVSWMRDFKLRASYGVLGNLGGISYDAVNPVMRRENYIIFGQDPQPNVAYFPSVYPNPNLKWGKSEQTNFGIDMGFLNSRLTLTADYFIKKSKDQIFEVPLPITAGYKTTFINAGLFEDKGYEIGLNFQGPRGREIFYSFNANLSHLQNKVKEMPVQQIAMNNSVRGVLYPTRVVVGDALYSFYGYKTAGLFQSQEEINNYKDANGVLIQPNAKPGDIKFLKKEGNTGRLNNDDMVYLGNPYPKLNYGFSANFSYKGFDINAFFQGVYGSKIFNGLKFITLNPGGTGQNYNMDTDILNAWTPNNTGASIPRLAIGDPSGNYSRVSDFYIEKGDYLRLKNLTVGYTLPLKYTEMIDIKSVRIYITADNLVTFTNYKGFDPEVGMNNYGIDIGRYPQARTVLFGLNVGL